MSSQQYHLQVMTQEVLEALHIENQAKFIDATLGSGGHTLEILKRGGRVLGIEADPDIYELAVNRIIESLEDKSFIPGTCPVPNQKIGDFFTGRVGNFINIDSIAKESDFENVSGILLDLGVNNIQLTSLSRGFSFQNPDAPLDMRIDPSTQGVKAADMLNVLNEGQLFDMFKTTLPFFNAKLLAKKVLIRRGTKAFEKVGDLIEIVEPIKSKSKLNPATLPLLALRIAVNTELDNLKIVLPKAYELLKKEGRLVVISFHSKEDEIVEKYFQEMKQKGSKVLSETYISPKESEISNNVRSRSSRLRVLIK